FCLLRAYDAWPDQQPADERYELASPHCIPRGSRRSIVAVQTRLVKGRSDVRFGSQADTRTAKGHVRFTLESGHRLSGRSELGFCWEPTLRRIFINSVWKFARQSGKQFVSR